MMGSTNLPCILLQKKFEQRSAVSGIQAIPRAQAIPLIRLLKAFDVAQVQ